MPDRWSADQVHALAPDTSSLHAARGLATPAKWLETGYAEGTPPSLWGRCEGSGAMPYQTCVDLAEPAYRCSCPSRKVPCKHALALLLLWSGGSVPPGAEPGWVRGWHDGRAALVEEAQARRQKARTTGSDEKAARKRLAQRADRVATGLAELEQWLDDQVRQGIAGLDRAEYSHWDRMAARLVDAQAPGVAGQVRRLAWVAGSGAGWEGRLLSELSLLRLLAGAYRRVDTLPESLAATVRARIGFTTPTEQVLASPPVRDEWQILAVRDQFEERLTTRRAWLRGRSTGRSGLVLSFAVPAQPLPADLMAGTTIEADLCFYPGAPALRAVVATRHGAPTPCAHPSPAVSIGAALDEYADALAADPWLTAWPVLLAGALVPGRVWHVADAAGDALPLYSGADEPWRLLAASGGRAAAIAGELGPAGFRPLSVFCDAEVAVW